MFEGILKISVLSLCISSLFAGVSDNHRQYRPDRILVVPKRGAESRLQEFHKNKGRRVKHRFTEMGVEVLEIDARRDAALVAQDYMASGLVEFAEPDYRLHACEIPNDPGFLKCWGLNNTGQGGGLVGADIGAESAWSVRNSAENVIVAVIDSGVRYTHEDLAANLWHNPKETANGKDDDGNGIIDDIYGYDAFGSSGDPWDDCGHGTHVAGTIGAVGNNGKGIAGVCWKVKIMALKFLASDGYGDTSDAIACIDYARKNGAKVINGSWGGSENSYALQSAINSARNAGIIFVTAAGNECSNNDLTPSYPGNYNLDNIVSVAAVNRQGEFDFYYSNWGATTVSLAAPGTEIYSTSFSGDNEYEFLTGTSMATPHVTAAIALLRAAYPKDSYLSIINRLYAAVEKVPSLDGKCRTGGRLSLAKLFPSPSVGELSISNVALNPDATLQFNAGTAGANAVVESSIDMRSWTALTPITRTGNSIKLSVPPDAHRFYRLRVP